MKGKKNFKRIVSEFINFTRTKILLAQVLTFCPVFGGHWHPLRCKKNSMTNNLKSGAIIATHFFNPKSESLKVVFHFLVNSHSKTNSQNSSFFFRFPIPIQGHRDTRAYSSNARLRQDAPRGPHQSVSGVLKPCYLTN